MKVDNKGFTVQYINVSYNYHLLPSRHSYPGTIVHNYSANSIGVMQRSLYLYIRLGLAEQTVKETTGSVL